MEPEASLHGEGCPVRILLGSGPQNPVWEDRGNPPLIQGTKSAPGIFLGAGDGAAKEDTRIPPPSPFPQAAPRLGETPPVVTTSWCPHQRDLRLSAGGAGDWLLVNATGNSDGMSLPRLGFERQ